MSRVILNTPTQFGVGDGAKKLFPFYDGARRVFDPLVSAVYRNDWQGAQLLYTTPRTNYALQTENFSSPSWSKISTTVTPNTDPAPDGVGAMDTLTGTAAVTSYVQQVINGLTPGAVYTVSMFVKAGTSARTTVSVYNTTISSLLAAIGILWTGGVPSLFPPSGVWAVAPTIRETSTPGVYLLSGGVATNALTGFGVLFYPAPLNTADTSKVWGLNLKPGAAYTPYIPSTTAPVTVTDYRLVDGQALLAVPPAPLAALLWTGSYDSGQELDFSVDLMRNLLWQYNDAVALQSLMESKQEWYTRTQTEFWENWVRDVFDLRTANEFGLSVWSIILAVPLVVTPDPDPPNKPIWGFGSGNTRVNFNNGNFATTSGSFGLTTEQKRLVLRMRYFQLVTRGAAPEINAFLARLFADQGTIYVADSGGMKARYIFGFVPDAALELVLQSFDLLPRPEGVGVDYAIVGQADGWGFGRYRVNFNNGNFYHA